MEKKKKGKRKNEMPVESLELDHELLNPSVQSPEESIESADSQVCSRSWFQVTWIDLPSWLESFIHLGLDQK